MRHLNCDVVHQIRWLLSQPAIARDEGPAPPIEKAPYHLPVFKNECVTMSKINLPRHRNPGFHIHTTDSVSVNIEEAEMANQLPGEKPTPPVPSVHRPISPPIRSRGREPIRPRTWGRQPFTTFRSCLTTLSPAGSRHPRDPVFSAIRRSWITNARLASCAGPDQPRLPLSRPHPDCASCSMVRKSPKSWQANRTAA